MRILAGQFKGRVLQPFKNRHIRPTTSRVRESLFNQLQFDIKGRTVLDLFSGTGILGIEALSRGAESVCFVDKQESSVRLLRSNLKLFPIENQCSIFKGDVFFFFKNKHQPYDIIFADPPFTQALADEVMRALSQSSLFYDETVVAIESGIKEKINKTYPPFVLKSQKNFGDKLLSIFFLSKARVSKL